MEEGICIHVSCMCVEGQKCSPLEEGPTVRHMYIYIHVCACIVAQGSQASR